MEELFTQFISNIILGEMKEYKNIAVVPLFSGSKGKTGYITLKEAFGKKYIRISEVNSGGSVPELSVENNGDELIILVDGEELIGAKQNRIINTTILLEKKSKTVIPVSCTEAGRWSYTTPDFKDSDVLLNYEIRQAKTRSVSDSLNINRDYRSNQREVWDRIEKISSEVNVDSPTYAIKDVFNSVKNQTDDFIKNFPVEKGQNGLLVMVNGYAAGFDIFSLETAYEKIHTKLIKSYAVDAIRPLKNSAKTPDMQTAFDFLNEAKKSNQTRFKSKGLGDDIRFESLNCVGSSLCLEEEIIHMAFFIIARENDPGYMDGYRKRMKNRY
jgi:hypothetical protein